MSRIFRTKWKELFSPMPIDIERMTAAELKHARLYNTTFWCIFGVLAILAECISFPDWERMISLMVIIVLFMIAFCSICQHLKLRKSSAGRKELPAISSFRVCFSDSDFYKRVDSFIVENHNTEYPMGSVECHALLEYVLEQPSSLIPGMSLNRLSYFVIKDYGQAGLLTFSTERAVAKAKITPGDKERIVKYFSK